MFLRQFSLSVSIISLGLLLTTQALSQDSRPNRFEFSHPQMGTVFKLIFYLPQGADKDFAQQAADSVFRRVDALNAIMSDYLPESELNRLCAQAGTGKWVTVSPDLGRILALSRKFSKESHGAFDVSIGALSRLWKRARNLKQLPDSTRIQDALALTGYEKIEIKKRRHQYRIRLARKNMQLDLGGIAQGYAADACLEVLAAFGIRAALADAGGDIAVGDPPVGQDGWILEMPSATSTPQSVKVRNCGITTSGAKYKYLEANGKRYSHIIDPRSGWGLTHRNLVTVQAPDATTADAWATALSVLRTQDWDKIKRKHKDLRVWVLEMGLGTCK